MFACSLSHLSGMQTMHE
uniref:Uncharacterized protein n=1 Tax=Anguilla anguilla TaxID=7936 RepID=A0A0E9QPP2_ANGAN